MATLQQNQSTLTEQRALANQTNMDNCTIVDTLPDHEDERNVYDDANTSNTLTDEFEVIGSVGWFFIDIC